MKHIIFAGNCQMFTLSNVYRNSISSTTGDIVEYVDVHQAVSAEVMDERRRTIEAADVLIAQVTATKAWLDVSAFDTAAVTLLVPVVGAGLFWPFAGQPHPKSLSMAYRPYGAEHSDAYLNKLISRGVPPQQALLEYKNLDVNSSMQLDRLFELWIDRQAARDEMCDGFKFHEIINAYFRREPLFRTPYHPNSRIYNHLIETLFRRLNINPDVITRIASAQRTSPFENLELPIHPSVARHFKLSYVAEGSRYRCREEGSFTFDEWVLRYMTHEWNEELFNGLRLQHTDRKAAVRMLRIGVETSPRSVVGRVALGRLLHAEGNAEEGLAQIRSAIDLQSRDTDGSLAIADPEAPEMELAQAYGELGHLLLRQGDLDGAETAFSKAVEFDPFAPGLHNALADVLARRGRHEEALTILRGLVERGTPDAHVYNQLGHLLARRGDLDAAEAAFRDAIRLDPVLTGFHTALAGVLDRQGRSEEAVGIVNGLIDAGMRDVHVYGQLGHLLLRRGELEAAEAAFRRASETDPGAHGYRRALADVTARQGRRDEALAILREVIAAGTGDPHIHALQGHLLSQSGELEGAEAAFRRASEMDPAVAGFRNALADVLARQGRPLSR